MSFGPQLHGLQLTMGGCDSKFHEFRSSHRIFDLKRLGQASREPLLFFFGWKKVARYLSHMDTAAAASHSLKIQRKNKQQQSSCCDAAEC
jgi:hypothetical protein